ENNPNIKKFLDESFKDVYLGRYKGLSAKKFREYTPQQTQTFENYLATHEVKGNRWLPSAKYIHEKMKTNTHPNLKAYIENLFVAVPFELKGSDALSQLEACIRHDYTDDQIDRMEKSLAKKNEPSKTISETAAEENEVTMENNKTESTGEELNDAEAAQKQSTAINPFDVEIPQNAVTQSEEFQNTLSKMQDAWNDYLQGKIDIRETDNAIDKVIREYTSPILNSRGFSSIHAETFRALYDIHEKIRTEAEKIERETKAAEKQSSSENKQAASKATEQKAIDPIEQRAREALKAAGLEGKTAPEKYHSRQPYEHGNQYLVEILTKEKPDSNIKRNITKLANQFGGFKVEDPNSVAWGYYFYEDEKEAAQAFKKALDIYFENAPEKLTPKEKFARKVDAAVEKLKAAHDFSDKQIKGVDFIGERIKSYGEPMTFEEFANHFSGVANIFLDSILGDRYAEVIDELNGYLNEEATANVEESGASERLDDGHRDVEPAIRTGTDEETRTQGRTENVGDDSGRERQTSSGVGENITRTNAENARPVSADDAGSTSARTGERAGLRGNSETVQPAARTDRGNANVSGNAENVNESEIEQRARAAIKSAGLEGKGAYESRNISVKVAPISDGKIIGGKVYLKVSIDIGKATGLTTTDLDAYEKIAKEFNAQQYPTEYAYKCLAEDAPALKRAFEIYLSNSTDERIKAAFEKLRAENNFSDEQLKWLERLEKYMHDRKAYPWTGITELDRPYWFSTAENPISFTSEIGGVENLDKLFDGKLAEIMDAANKSVYLKKSVAKPYETAGHNFQITEDSGIGDGGLKTKFKQNIDAIKLLKQLEREERKATPSEQEILAKFNGWGTLAPAFSNAKDWQKENQELRELLTDEEYAAARGAIRNAFYTSPEIAKTIWSGLKRLGFTGGRILDPSMGSGIFFGTMPSEIAVQSALTGVELDSLTGRIAQQLYQGADIEITGFQNRNLPDNYFDLAITNVPFDSVRILEDPKYSKANLQLHDYFFAKSMDKIRPGGLVAFITSTGTLNEPRQIAKLYDGKADLIAAFKLPSQTFDKNAGTQVTTDIVIFQKRIDPDKASEHAQEWTKVTKNFSAAKIGSTETKRVKINEYFINHPDHMIGTPVLDKLYAGSSPRMGLDGKGRDVVKELGDLMNKLPENIYLPIQRETPSTLDNTLAKFSSRQTEGDFAIVGGKVYQRQDGKRVEVADKDAPTVKDYLGLAKILERLLSAQLNPDTTDERLSELRKNLNQKYDAFTKNHGYLNAPQNVKILSEDSSFGRVAAIENYHVDKKTKQESSSKTDIFFKRTATPIEEPTTADTAIDGLTLSLAMRGRVDMQYISSLTGKNESELERELGDWLYKNPETNEHELAEEYLSGNVREKYSQAKEAAKKNPAFNRNVEALKKVIPLEVPADGIAVQLGTTWIDPKYYEDFVRHMLGDDVKKIKINLSNELGKWFVEGNARSDGSEFRKWTVQKAKVGEVNFFELLEMALNKKTPSFTTDKKPDEAANAEARAKVERINAAFADWIWADEARMEDLLRSFNSAYNSNVLRNYDGSHLTFPGLARDVKEKLYPHQKDVIWRIMQGKNTLIAHCVGAGKTWSMQIAAMEMKRLGTINKPLFAVPNAIVEQFRQEFLRAYPSARILVLTSENLPSVTGAKNESATDKKKRIAQRERTLNRIVTGDWDGIIISHNLFERLPVSPEAEEDFLFEQIRLLTAEKYAVAKMQGKGTDTTKFVKQLEAAIARLNQRIKANTNSARREICIPFDELGIDQIFVDEADMFKNLGFKSQFVQRHNAGAPKVVGVSTTNAKRSWDLYMKTRILSQMPRKNGNKGGGVVFATGTPVSNSLSEIFTTMRYLAAEELEEKNISFFDGWAQGFVKGIPTVELSPDGSGFESVIRLKMTNLFALINMYRQIADIKMPEDLPHLKRPKLKNDSRTVVEIEQPEVYKKYLLKVQERAQAIHDGNVKPEEDNFLKITNDLKNASLDMRLIDPTIPESEAGAKLDALCDMVTAKYHETADINGTQVIFSDIGVPKGKDLDKEAKEADSDEQPAIDTETSAETVTVYERIKRGLIKRGIPANQIAFVHEAKTPEERQALFNRVNDGEIRVLIGSTEIMGAGVNIQKRLAALHHLTCPWRPRDIEQREGRILRAGNENAEVEIFTYVTKDTFDANMWEKVTLKKEMMDAFLRGDPSIKEIDDFNSEETLGFDDVMNTGITDKSAKETAALKTKIRALTYEKNLFAQRMRDKRLEQKKISARIPQAEQAIKNIQADIAEKISTKGDAFKMKIGKIEYTDRVEAGKAFDNLIKSFRSGASKKVGEIGGFDINMRAEDTLINRGGVTEVLNTRVFVTLSNHGIYSAEPSLRSIEHFISHGGIEMQLESDEKQLKKAKVQLAVLEDALSKPFGKQAELDEAIEALEEIEHRLSGKPENAGTPAQLETASEETANVTESATQVEKPDEESANAQEISQEIEDSPNGRLEYLGGVTKQYTARTKGEKAIKDAPNGAIIQITAESNDGETRTEYYHVAGDFLERVEANGEQSGESFPQNQKGIKNNMAILDADNFKLKSITITERPADVDTQKLIALAHKNLKTDTHPALKEWLERREKALAEANPYNRVSVLDGILDSAIFTPSDEELRKDEAYHAEMYAKQARAKESEKISETSTTQELTRQETETKSQTATEQAE
ncbi:MAG: DEAD/DEAH box helicase family protein, partial [Selenomonadaceae bacterium]|nr:DEAD/DEAH box helicase family protein [Selenomonadaceae bacterium]